MFESCDRIRSACYEARLTSACSPDQGRSADPSTGSGPGGRSFEIGFKGAIEVLVGSMFASI